MRENEQDDRLNEKFDEKCNEINVVKIGMRKRMKDLPADRKVLSSEETKRQENPK